ncbi:MAG: hypothetical protein NVSMB23_09000 [Myxococcales bacterium]
MNLSVAIRASVASALVAVAAGAAPAPGKPVVAVLPLRALGGPPAEAQALEKALRDEVAALPEVVAASPDAVASALKREPDCAAQIVCAAAAVARAGAQQFITGTVSSLGDTHTLDLKLIDARTGQELRRATHPVSGRQDRVIELLRATAVELLAHARYAGKLDVQVANDANAVARGAQLFLDGKLRGQLPLSEPLSGIPPGQHTLRVAKQGFLDATLFVEVRYGETSEARLDLTDSVVGARAAPAEPGEPRTSPTRQAGAKQEAKPESTPPPPFVLSTGGRPELRDPLLQIAGWSGVGVGAVALVAGIAFHAKAFSTADDLNRRAAAGQLTAADLPAVADVATEMRVARVLYVVGGAIAATGATLLVWDRMETGKLQLSAAPLPAGGGALSLAGRF